MKDKERAEMILRLVAAMIYLGYLIWVMIPGHKRKLWMMRAAETARRAAGRAARAAGRAGMGRELADGRERDDTYTAAFWLSRARDTAAGAYEKLRDVTP